MDYAFRRNGNLIRLNGTVPKSNFCPCGGFCIGYFCDLGDDGDPEAEFHLTGYTESGETRTRTMFPLKPFSGEARKVYAIPFEQAWYGRRINGLRLHLITLLPSGHGGHNFVLQDGICSVHPGEDAANDLIRRYQMTVTENDDGYCEFSMALDLPDEFE